MTALAFHSDKAEERDRVPSQSSLFWKQMAVGRMVPSTHVLHRDIQTSPYQHIMDRCINDVVSFMLDKQILRDYSDNSSDGAAT